LRETDLKLHVIYAALDSPELTEEKRTKLLEDQARQEKLLDHYREMVIREPSDEMARHFIVAWKTERELHRKYGGRIIFQQFGLEALDARRMLYEEAEKNGDLKFDDPGVRYMFYYYSNMRHSVIDDDKALEEPWFFRSRRKTTDGRPNQASPAAGEVHPKNP